MAKGNDGNYLQHSVEIAAANRLAVENPCGLHIALTHGMAPFEPFEHKLSEPRAGLVRRSLKAALQLASRPRRKHEPSIVTAYRKTDASETHYPNSAELLRTLHRGHKTCGLSGGITEVCPAKHRELDRAWTRSSVRVAPASWRSQLDGNGVLACPADLQVPWLFSMDPMTYLDEGHLDESHHDDDHLYASDVTRLSDVLADYAASGQPGVATLFAYNVRPTRQCRFWKFTACLARRTGSGLRRHAQVHRGGNRNLAALLHFSIDVPTDFIQDAVDEMEDVALVAAIQASEREFSSREAVFRILEA